VLEPCARVTQDQKDRHNANSRARAVLFSNLSLQEFEAKGSHERGQRWWCLHTAASHLEARINRPRPPLLYVVNVCFKCFTYFRDMLQVLLYRYCKSGSGCCICCMCF
jgi:hypothetical protein